MTPEEQAAFEKDSETIAAYQQDVDRRLSSGNTLAFLVKGSERWPIAIDVALQEHERAEIASEDRESWKQLHDFRTEEMAKLEKRIAELQERMKTVVIWLRRGLKTTDPISPAVASEFALGVAVAALGESEAT